MKPFDITRALLSVGIMAAVSGCGNPANGPGGGLIPQGFALVAPSREGRSWMLPAAKTQDLVYLSTLGPNIYVYSYPALKQVGQLTGFHFTVSECTDKDGNIYITDQSLSAGGLYEYAHGGTEPLRVIQDSSFPFACAVDGKSGDLAVINDTQVMVYQNATGAPSTYSPGGNLTDATYDGSGNLFVAGETSGFALTSCLAAVRPFNGFK